MDYGYPQLVTPDLLKEFIKIGSVKDEYTPKAANGVEQPITNILTGQCDWRPAGKYKYRKNEVFLDVLESINLLMSSKGAVLRTDVQGKIVMKAFLSGMPECKFGLNDKLMLDKDAKKSADRYDPTRPTPPSSFFLIDCVHLSTHITSHLWFILVFVWSRLHPPPLHLLFAAAAPAARRPAATASPSTTSSSTAACAWASSRPTAPSPSSRPTESTS
jgi:hypothetical protein